MTRKAAKDLAVGDHVSGLPGHPLVQVDKNSSHWPNHRKLTWALPSGHTFEGVAPDAVEFEVVREAE